LRCWCDCRHTLAVEGFCSLVELIEGRLTKEDLKELDPELKLRDRKMLQVTSQFRNWLFTLHVGLMHGALPRWS
jgi:hypothetical protein